MVEHQPAPAELDAVFHALADPTRRAMLARLADGERSVGELAAPFAMSLAAASKHVKTLETAGLLARRVEGRVHRCRLDPAGLLRAGRWLRHYERFWTERLDALEELLEAEDAAAAATATRNPTNHDPEDDPEGEDR